MTNDIALLRLCSVIVLRTLPEIYGKSLEKVIGAPHDYNKNKENDQFADSYDLRLPVSEAERMEIEVEEETAAARLETPVRPQIQAKEEVKFEEQPREEIMISAAKSERPAQDYMPIKALNQFVSDWCIKARIVKKGPLKEWSNAKGSGKLLNIDLVDKAGTMIQATAFHD